MRKGLLLIVLIFLFSISFAHSTDVIINEGTSKSTNTEYSSLVVVGSEMEVNSRANIPTNYSNDGGIPISLYDSIKLNKTKSYFNQTLIFCPTCDNPINISYYAITVLFGGFILAIILYTLAAVGYKIIKRKKRDNDKDGKKNEQ